MAEAKLNFDEAQLVEGTNLYDLYTRFYNGMSAAQKVDAPNYVADPPLTEDGAIDEAKISEELDNYSDILMKNSAYMLANSIISTLSGGGGGGQTGIGYVSRNGDTMTGLLGALYGFEAGYSNNKIIDVTINSSDEKVAHIYGNLLVDEDATIDGALHLSNDGFYIGAQQVMYVDEGVLNLNYQDILMTGDIEVDGSMSFGNVLIDENGILFGDYEFYHSGNANKSDVSWTMLDANVYGDLTVEGDTELNGELSAEQGFTLGAGGRGMIFSSTKTDGTSEINLASDLILQTGYAIKFNNTYIIKVRQGTDNIVSFAAPGMILNLGDSDGTTATNKISLQADIYNASNTTRLVSKDGDGNFPNSLSAGCANSGDTVLQTYYKSTDDCGVVFGHYIRFGESGGPGLSANSTNNGLDGVMPFTTVQNDVQRTFQIPFGLKYEPTTSLFKALNVKYSASLNLDTDAEFFVFKKGVEAPTFTVISQTYKTRLAENVLYFADAVYLEGITGGIRHQGNSVFTGNLSSTRFATGFAGYGWAIMQDQLYGNIAATFDELTIRKKMRVYELEVQKLSVTNGSLWVSDACSGDLVQEIS